MRLIDANMLIRKYIDPDIKKFSNSDVKIVLENLKQNLLKAPTINKEYNALSDLVNVQRELINALNKKIGALEEHNQVLKNMLESMIEELDRQTEGSKR